MTPGGGEHLPAFHRDSPTRKAYTGGGSIVSFDGAVCEHAGLCVKRLPLVFDTAKRPWIDPLAASPAEVEAAVARCPSGALRFSTAA